jgi:uncharacterized phage protein gp47/JayE
MADLQTKDFGQLNQEQQQAIQANASINLQKTLNFTEGSLLLAQVESNSGVALWLQGICVKLLAISRLATSVGIDVDTFLEQFGLKRLQAVAATGFATFSRFSSTEQASISVGSQISSSFTGLVFSVVVDTTNPYYYAPTSSYIIPVGVLSANILVQCVTTGEIGNVAAGTINTIVNPILHVDSVTNNAPFTNGVDKESDTNAKKRFILYINSLSKATITAIQATLSGLQDNIFYNIVENKNYATNADQYGYFYVVLDDGSGDPPDDLIQRAYNALYVTRGLTIMFEIFKPELVTANISVQIKASSENTSYTIANDVSNAIKTYVATLQVGQPLYYTKIADICYDASDSIVNVHNVLINGSTLDVSVDGKTKVMIGTVVVSEDV